MLNMVGWTVLDLVPMYSNFAMAMHASNITASAARQTTYRSHHPAALLGAARKFEQLQHLALVHLRRHFFPQ